MISQENVVRIKVTKKNWKLPNEILSILFLIVMQKGSTNNIL